MRYAFIDDEGRVLSAHNDDTVDELPDGAVLIDESQFEDRFNLRWTGHTWIQDAADIGDAVIHQAKVQVSRFQLFAALLELGELDKALDWAKNEAEPLHKLALEMSPVFSPASDTIKALAVDLDWTDEFVQHLFERAATAQA